MGVEDMDFPGVLKKQQVEFPGVKFKNVEFPALIKKKIMWNSRVISFRC